MSRLSLVIRLGINPELFLRNVWVVKGVCDIFVSCEFFDQFFTIGSSKREIKIDIEVSI